MDANRPPHPETEAEMALAVAEAVGLVVTYHPVGFGCPDTQRGWFYIRCPRSCHEPVRIDAQKADRITMGQFSAWFSAVMIAHDTADVEGA